MTDKAEHNVLELERFLPYRLSVLSNTVSQAIAATYERRFALTITEWRVMAVLGRYDGLSESIGGPPLPGVGWALGVDRTVLAFDAEEVELPVPPSCQVFAVPIGDAAKRKLFGLVAELRNRGISADLAYGDRGMKGAMKAADRSGAAYAIVLGERDLEAGVAQVKDLASGEQTAIAWDGLAADLQRRMLP